VKFFTVYKRLLQLGTGGHACNPSNIGGRDQGDQGLKPARANSSQDPILKKALHKNRAGRVTQDEGPEFKPQYCKTKPKTIQKTFAHIILKKDFCIHYF
jgi:hypothetical protein